MAQGCEPVKDGEDKITLEVGTNNWPMPIPLVKADGQWHFDTAAGKEEIINRHIGKDELHAIGVCRAYVTAQRQYASMNPDAGGEANYAQKFKSTPGKKDGLYWPAAENEPASPFGPLVAEAHAEGYVHAQGHGPASVSRLLFQNSDPARQGRARRENGLHERRQFDGGIRAGGLSGALGPVGHHDLYRQSGRQSLSAQSGRKDPRIARAMKEYNPDSEWTLVQDQGVIGAVSEK